MGWSIDHKPFPHKKYNKMKQLYADEKVLKLGKVVLKFDFNNKERSTISCKLIYFN